jgi:oligoribonuclease NrnB/cAMP/cGMP phosphodiesterase (DHH superfamily)
MKKTEIKHIDNNQRIIRINSFWYPQIRFKLFWFIPTPFWRYYGRITEDLTWGEYFQKVGFFTQDGAINYLLENENINIIDNKLTIIYHSADLDGITSGALLKREFPDADFHGYNYSQPIDFELKKYIIFADVSFDIKKMYELSKNHHIIWIDHHISRYNEYLEYKEKYGDFCEIIFNNNYAACVNVYKWLYPNTTNIPYGLQLLGDYDIWNQKTENYWNNEVLPFQYGMRAIATNIDNFPHEILWDIDLVKKISVDGTKLLDYQTKLNEKACKNAFEIKFNNYTCIALNVGGANSIVFDSVYNPNKHDIMMPFFYTGEYWKISMYTTKNDIDCSLIAKKYGGGGHKKAAGFEIDNIDFITKYKQ